LVSVAGIIGRQLVLDPIVDDSIETHVQGVIVWQGLQALGWATVCRCVSSVWSVSVLCSCYKLCYMNFFWQKNKGGKSMYPCTLRIYAVFYFDVIFSRWFHSMLRIMQIQRSYWQLLIHSLVFLIYFLICLNI